MVEQRLRELDNKLEGLSRRWPVADPQAFLSFQDKLTTLWLYHDHALEGIALSGEDISDALTEKTFPERTRDALCKSIRDHKLTIDFVKQQGLLHAGQVRGLVTVPLLRKLHESLAPSEKGEGHPFRSDRVLHRLYHHPIIPAGQIAASLRKLCESIDEAREAHHHPPAGRGLRHLHRRHLDAVGDVRLRRDRQLNDRDGTCDSPAMGQPTRHFSPGNGSLYLQ